MHQDKTTAKHCHVLTVIDGVSEEIIDVIEIKHFEIEGFSTQFDVPVETDPEMLDRYAVGPDDLPFLKAALAEEVHFDLSKYAYFIEAVTIDA